MVNNLLLKIYRQIYYSAIKFKMEILNAGIFLSKFLCIKNKAPSEIHSIVILNRKENKTRGIKSLPNYTPSFNN